MEHKYGPMIKATVLILQAYKAMIYVSKDIEVSAEGRVTDLMKAYVVMFNEEFYGKDDKVDSYLERLFDVLSVPKATSLRKLCGESVLDYLVDKENVLDTIQRILILKNSYEQNPENFERENKG